MNQIPIYQHPFVDVFKLTKLTEWITSQKEGDVQENVWDQKLAKNYVRIQGTSSSSNYIQVPATKFLPKKALGLTGKFVYILLNKPDGKNCVLHLDYMVNETRLTKISLSNIYKDFKNINGSSLQIPLNIQSDRWTVVCINVEELLESHHIFLPNQSKQFLLRSFQICSTVNVRGVFTSDIQYQVPTLPKDMQFKIPKDHDWFSQYSWFQYPSSGLQGDDLEHDEVDVDNGQRDKGAKAQNQENSSLKANSKKLKQPTKLTKEEQAGRPQTASKSKQQAGGQAPQNSQGNSKSQKKIQPKSSKLANQVSSLFQPESKDKQNADIAALDDFNGGEANDDQASTKYTRQSAEQNQQAIRRAHFAEDEQSESDGFNGQIEKTMKEITVLKEDFNYNLHAKKLTEQAEITLYQGSSLLDREFDPKNMHKKKDKFILKPNPIMRLDRVVGWHPHYTSSQIYFNHDPKLSKEILYSQANLLLGFYPPLQKQRLFYERHTNNIDQLFVENCPNNLSFAFTVCKSLEEKSKDNEVTIWSLDNLDTTNAQSQSIFTFKPPLKSIHSVSISCGPEMEYLCLAGKDHQIRDVIIIYKFVELIKFKKVEIVARQLADFECHFVRFNSVVQNSVIACGKENIKFFKIKNGHLPGQSVILNNTARGKFFHKAIVQKNEPEGQKAGNATQKSSYVFVATTDGLLYFINYATRQVDKIIQIHEDTIQALVAAPNNQFYVTASKNGILRIWSTDFQNLKSEVNTGNQITHCDVNCDSNQICVLSAPMGTISVLDLENSSYNVVLRSHLDNVTDLAYNHMLGKLITVGEDYCVKVWHAESMEQVNEFVSENDLPVRVVSQNQGLLGEGIPCDDTDTLVAIGFKSGFLRMLDLNEMKIVHETLLFQSPVMAIEFSLDNKFMAVFFKSGKIVIINKERPGQFLPVKNIDYELPNQNYCSLSFSVDSSMLANISSNANTITVWETRNFSLRYHLDVTGDTISKIQFAPNGKDLVLLTTSSKLKFYRLGASARDQELTHVKDSYGITDMECIDFQITSNNRYIICSGKEGVIKVYDYFMRGEVIASSQAFLGHFKFPRRVIIQKDMRNVFSIGELNGIYKWTFYGDTSNPDDITQYFEELESERAAKAAMTTEDLEKQRVDEGLFDQPELQQYTEQQIEKLNQNFKSGNNNLNPNNQNTKQQMAHQANQMSQQHMATQQRDPQLQHTIDMNKGGYVYERFEMQLSKVLACSNGAQVIDNVLWNEKQRYMAYSIQNIIVIETLNQEKTQKLLKEGNDPIYQIQMAPNKLYLLAYTRTGPIDGFPCVYIFDAATLKKLNQIAISDAQIDSVKFSEQSNMLLVVSSTTQGEEHITSTLTIWDFLDGHKDIFCKSMIPMAIKHSCWNPYIQKSADEFVTISDRCYHYWRITENLQLQYQEGELPKKQTEGFKDKSDMFTTVTFVRPDHLHHSVYLLIGLKSGYVWVADARVNQYLFNVKVLDGLSGGVRKIYSSHARIIIETLNSQILHCWDQSGKNGEEEYSSYNPCNLFVGKETTLSIDGDVKASSYDDIGNQMIVLSTSGSMWYLNWVEHVTIRLKSCHNPTKQILCADYKYVSPNEFNIEEEQDQVYTFDQNYQITTASSDGQIKLWNMHDLEYCQQFIVPKEECIYIAMHQFKPYMVSSFTDGYLRFFDLNTSQLLGRCQIHLGIEDQDPKQKDNQEQQSIVDYAVSIKILPSGNHIFAATKNGQIVLIFVNSWSPLAINIHSVISIQTSINAFEFSYLEPYNKWLVATSNGKVIVYNRKDFNSLNQEIFDELKPPEFNYMDSFNLQEYVSNGYSQTTRTNTVDHYYSMAKRNLVYNEVDPMHECEGVFANNDLTLHLSFIRQCNYLIIRNFELHQVVKRIEMSSTSLPVNMQLMPGSSPFVCVAMKDNSVKLIDFMNEANQAWIETMHEELTTMKVCPNGRYVLTAGNRGDVSLWSVRKQILAPEAIQDAIYTKL